AAQVPAMPSSALVVGVRVVVNAMVPEASGSVSVRGAVAADGSIVIFCRLTLVNVILRPFWPMQEFHDVNVVGVGSLPAPVSTVKIVPVVPVAYTLAKMTVPPPLASVRRKRKSKRIPEPLISSTKSSPEPVKVGPPTSGATTDQLPAVALPAAESAH